jgi:hypothetical protein
MPKLSERHAALLDEFEDECQAVLLCIERERRLIGGFWRRFPGSINIGKIGDD